MVVACLALACVSMWSRFLCACEGGVAWGCRCGRPACGVCLTIVFLLQVWVSHPVVAWLRPSGSRGQPDVRRLAL